MGTVCTKQTEEEQILSIYSSKNQKRQTNMKPKASKDSSIKEHIPTQIETMNDELRRNPDFNQVREENKIPLEWLNEAEAKYYQSQVLGPFQYPDGSNYEGQYLNGKKHGFGVLQTPEGYEYEGTFENNKYEGKGRLILSENEYYIGGWKDGKRKGQGKYLNGEGLLYEGEWDNDTQTGVGQEVWANGTVYEGMFYEGVKNSQGKFVWADGSVYEGMWAEGMRNGIGTLKGTNPSPHPEPDH